MCWRGVAKGKEKLEMPVQEEVAQGASRRLEGKANKTADGEIDAEGRWLWLQKQKNQLTIWAGAIIARLPSEDGVHEREQ